MIQKNLDRINAQYEFKDNIPKRELVVKLRDDVTREELKEVRFSIMQHINDMSIYVDDRFAVQEMFARMKFSTTVFAMFFSVMILILTFFMMTVSFSQKIRDHTWE